MTSKVNDFHQAEEIAKYIQESKKTTPVKVYLQGHLQSIQSSEVKVFGQDRFWILLGEYSEVKKVLEANKSSIEDYHLENDRRNSAIPFKELLHLQARIEPGSFIREGVDIDKNAVVMMGAVINIGAKIGENSMIDMNCVIGARVIIGKNVHIGAGTVVAGILEPPSKKPVIIKDGVFVGANAVILEGVEIGEGSVIAAGSVVTKNVPPNTVVAGMPAKTIKIKDEKTADKVRILEDLRV